MEELKRLQEAREALEEALRVLDSLTDAEIDLAVNARPTAGVMFQAETAEDLAA